MVGIDAVRKSIKVAQYRLSHEPSIAHKVKYIEATVEDLVEAGEKSFDAVVASEVLEHVAEPAAFVQSCCKVLKVRCRSIPVNIELKLISILWHFCITT